MNWILLLLGIVILLLAYIAMKPLYKLSKWVPLGIALIGIMLIVIGLFVNKPEPYEEDEDDED